MIAVLDRNPNNTELLSRVLAEEGVSVLGADNLEAFEGLVADHPEAELALLDLAGLDASIWDACDRLHGRGIPFLLVIARPDGEAQRLGLAHGARAVLPKPLSVRMFRQTIRTLSRRGAA